MAKEFFGLMRSHFHSFKSTKRYRNIILKMLTRKRLSWFRFQLLLFKYFKSFGQGRRLFNILRNRRKYWVRFTHSRLKRWFIRYQWTYIRHTIFNTFVQNKVYKKFKGARRIRLIKRLGHWKKHWRGTVVRTFLYKKFHFKRPTTYMMLKRSFKRAYKRIRRSSEFRKIWFQMIKHGKSPKTTLHFLWMMFDASFQKRVRNKKFFRKFYRIHRVRLAKYFKRSVWKYARRYILIKRFSKKSYQARITSHQKKTKFIAMLANYIKSKNIKKFYPGLFVFKRKVYKRAQRSAKKQLKKYFRSVHYKIHLIRFLK